jgi:hypothetical protein
MSKYASGGMSLQDALGSIQKLPSASASNADWGKPITNWSAALGGDPNNAGPAVDKNGALAALATDPITGSKIANEQVMNNPLYAGLFGQDGLGKKAQDNYSLYGQQALNQQQNIADDRNALLGRDQSYGLTDNDLAAYGQASGNIARNFAANDANLAQSLADRGLSQGGSMSAIANFGGALGNKNEQLAQLQTQIATNRINTAKELAQSRASADQANQNAMLGAQSSAGSLAGNIGQLGMNAQNQQYNQQLQGAENAYNTQAGAAGQAMQNQNLQQNINNSQWAQDQASNPLNTILGSAAGSAGKAVGKAVGGEIASVI